MRRPWIILMLAGALLAPAGMAASMDEAIRTLDALDRATPRATLWHREHALVAGGGQDELQALLAAVHPPEDGWPWPHFPGDRPGEAVGRAERQAHHGQFALAVVRATRAEGRTLIDGLKAHPFAAEAVERIAALENVRPVAPVARGARDDLNTLDLSWFIEAIVRLDGPRARWRDVNGVELSVPLLIETQLRLYDLDRRHRLNVVTEYGVHILGMLSVAIGDDTPVPWRERAQRIAADLLGRTCCTPAEYSMLAHLLELDGWVPQELRDAMPAIAEQVVAHACDVDAKKSYTFVSHALGALRRSAAHRRN